MNHYLRSRMSGPSGPMLREGALTGRRPVGLAKPSASDSCPPEVLAPEVLATVGEKEFGAWRRKRDCVPPRPEPAPEARPA
jgi:hypothetical protein